MPLYLYCLTSPAADGPGAEVRGVDDAPVRALAVPGARAWVSDVASAPAPTVERARAHDRVIREAMRSGTPLPARFGQTFADETALGEELTGRATAVERALGRVSGLVEMTVRVRLTSGRPGKLMPSKELSGRGYLSSLRERERLDSEALGEAENLQARVARAVSGVARAEVVAGVGAGDRTVVIAHLVAPEEVGRYREAVRDAMRGEGPSRPVSITGPWAPYSFAELVDD
jgi:hypothetical protein